MLDIIQCFKENPGCRIELVDVIVLINHAKGFSRATLVVIVRWKEDNEWNEKDESFLLASTRCRMENTEVIVNTYRPRLNERMKIIQESGCVSIFSGILKDYNDKREEYVIIGLVETKRVETDEVIRVGVSVETWMAGDLLFFEIDLGKKGTVYHWYTFCYTSSALWKRGGSIEGQPWTLEKLKEHLKILESGDLNKRNADERKGVSSEALFDFVDIDHYVMPTLHLIPVIHPPSFCTSN